MQLDTTQVNKMHYYFYYIYAYESYSTCVKTIFISIPLVICLY